jgi:hypothetical protein
MMARNEGLKPITKYKTLSQELKTIPETLGFELLAPKKATTIPMVKGILKISR